jgi:hypothetical protein
MAFATSTILAITAAATVASTVMSAKASRDQAKAQKASMQAQSRAAGAEAQRARIQAVREARIQRAMMESAAGKAGIGFQSSGVVGAGSSIGSQLGANIGNQNVQLGFADMASAANQRAADAASRGAQWQAVGQVAGSIFQAKGGWGSIFGGNTMPSVGSGTASKATR